MGATDCVGWRVIGVNGGLDSGSSKGMVSAYIVLDLGMAVARISIGPLRGVLGPIDTWVGINPVSAASLAGCSALRCPFTSWVHRFGCLAFSMSEWSGPLYASHSPRSVRLGCIADPVGGALVLASILHSGGLTCDGALSSAMRLWPTSVWRAHRIWWWMILAPIFLGEPRLWVWWLGPAKLASASSGPWCVLDRLMVGCHPFGGAHAPLCL